ncbi:MAG TPA: hypothetical protein VLC46_01645 [Thermoanaerobaculia bacterium]|jgi:hypothetical protein|nr:hypothetical protein [Thermoanaerobaculia bacterium]
MRRTLHVSISTTSRFRWNGRVPPFLSDPSIESANPVSFRLRSLLVIVASHLAAALGERNKTEAP